MKLRAPAVWASTDSRDKRFFDWLKAAIKDNT